MLFEEKGYIFGLEREYIGHMFIYESRGINDNYTVIIDEIINCCKNIKPEQIDGNVYLYSMDNYHVKSYESFISTLNFRIFVQEDGNGGEFYMTDEKSKFLKNGRLINAMFEIVVDGKDGTFNEPLLRELLAHELHHAYRLYLLAAVYNKNLPNSEINRQNAYNHSIELMYGDGKKNVIGYLLYKTDENEVMALCAEAYEYLKNNKVIRRNYKEYAEKCEISNVINLIDSVLSSFKSYKENDIPTGGFGKMYNSFLKSKGKRTFNDETAFRLLKQFLLYKKNFIYNQFYKVIGKAIMENEKELNIIKTFPKVTSEKLNRELQIFLEHNRIIYGIDT